MQTTTKGLVIRQQTVGESDRLVTLLTADYGLVRAFVRGAKRIKNKNNSVTALFSYADFTFYRGRDAFVVDSAVPIELFFELRKDIKVLALAQYFAQLVYELGEEEQPGGEMLGLILNSLHLLCGGKKDLRQVKIAFELRMMCLGGYMPSVLACAKCAVYETDLMYFDVAEGCIYCRNCPVPGSIPVPKNVITAVRFICLTEPKRIFSFTLPEENLDLLSQISEKYLLSTLQRRFSTLEFFKGL